MSISSVSSNTVSSYYEKNSDFLSKIAQKVINKRDADKDNAVSMEESGLSGKKFTAVDADGDGKISSEELIKSMEDAVNQMQLPSPDMMANILGQSSSTSEESSTTSIEDFISKIISNEDKDGDGVISAAETRMPSNMFSRIDADGDGKLTAEEMQTDMENMPPPPRMGGMKKKKADDSDETDATNALEELLGTNDDSDLISKVVSKTIKKNDKDGDGALSSTETNMTAEKFAQLDKNSDGVLDSDELETKLTDITNQLKESYSVLSSLFQTPSPDQIGSLMNSYSMNSFSNTQKYFMSSYNNETAETNA